MQAPEERQVCRISPIFCVTAGKSRTLKPSREDQSSRAGENRLFSLSGFQHRLYGGNQKPEKSGASAENLYPDCLCLCSFRHWFLLCRSSPEGDRTKNSSLLFYHLKQLLELAICTLE